MISKLMPQIYYLSAMFLGFLIMVFTAHDPKWTGLALLIFSGFLFIECTRNNQI